VGAGPCGLFAAYELALHGYRPVLIERGRDVESRQQDVEEFWKSGRLNTASNVQFGEGGAGAFSDGKLNTMVKDRDGRGREALNIFVGAGAPEEILYEAKPHIGTDRLMEVVANIRRQIIEHGGEVLFNTKLTQIITSDSDASKDNTGNTEKIQLRANGTLDQAGSGQVPCRHVTGVRITDESGDRILETGHVILAIGHSARDTFEELHKENIHMEPKAFAVGLRVEHPQKKINISQYGTDAGLTLPPAPYKVVYNTKAGRGVYSFCMCPGGYVVNASSEEGRLCINGMSYYARDSRNANSAIIVTVKPEDFGGEGPLAGVAFQRRLEEKAYALGGGRIPAEYFCDYKAGVHASGPEDNHERAGWNRPCCRGEYVFADVHTLLPDEIRESIIEGMEHFGHMIKGFDSDDVLMEGVEARTSSPVRITRDESLQSVSLKGLYPCGEGAGYAGGIMSAAMDGIRTAAALAENCHPDFE
jgi:uncharacterized FAD-dependent dehydrogenase